MGKHNRHGGGGASPSADAKASAALAPQGTPAPVLQDDTVEEQTELDAGKADLETSPAESGGADAADDMVGDLQQAKSSNEAAEGASPAACDQSAADSERSDAASPADGASEDVAAPPVALTVGQELTCDAYEGGLVVRATVREVAPDGQQALLWIPALGRSWPIRARCVTGSTWAHDVEDYPAPGDDTAFDAEFRPPAPEEKAAAPRAPDEPFKPPRSARLGHVWAIALHHVAAIGYDADGAPRRNWSPNEPGEFRRIAVSGSPQAFRRL